MNTIFLNYKILEKEKDLPVAPSSPYFLKVQSLTHEIYWTVSVKWDDFECLVSRSEQSRGKKGERVDNSP